MSTPDIHVEETLTAALQGDPDAITQVAVLLRAGAQAGLQQLQSQQQAASAHETQSREQFRADANE